MELGRPWYVTGEGERLAVLVRAAEGAAAPATQATEVSRDPIWRTTRLPHWPSAASFRGRIGPDFATGDALALPYAVFFADDRWWADVSLPDVAGASYCPFVQLVVARFQPDSLPGLELSDAVVAEPVQLLPKRTLELARADGSLTATLRGVGPSVPTNSVEVVLERADPGTPTDLTRLLPDPSVPGWTPLRSATGTLGEAVSVTLEPGDGTRRVVVRETEPIATEASRGDTSTRPADGLRRRGPADLTPSDPSGQRDRTSHVREADQRHASRGRPTRRSGSGPRDRSLSSTRSSPAISTGCDRPASRASPARRSPSSARPPGHPRARSRGRGPARGRPA